MHYPCHCKGTIESHDICREFEKRPKLRPYDEVQNPGGIIITGEIPCALCEIYENVNHHCMECGQNLCNWCQLMHARGRPTFRHNTVKIDLWLTLCGEIECPIHKDFYQNIYCVFCRKLVCGKCRKTKRKKHFWDSRPCFYPSKHNELVHRTKLFQEGTMGLEGLSYEERDIVKDLLVEERNRQIAEVDRIQNSMIKEVEESQKNAEEYKALMQKLYKEKCREFITKLDYYQKKARKLSEEEFNELCEKAEADLRKPLEDLPPIYNVKPPKFVPGDPKAPTMEEKFGRLQYDKNTQWMNDLLQIKHNKPETTTMKEMICTLTCDKRSDWQNDILSIKKIK